MSSKPCSTALVLLVALGLAPGCSKKDDDPGGPLKPGALLGNSALTLAGDSAELNDKAEVWLLKYTSTSGVSGDVVTVSGMVLIPKGRPQPPEGYPLISYGHGAVGFDKDCGPTKTKTLGPDDTPRVSALLDAGYVVAVADYQGLGEGPAHPFREPKTVGYNLVDAARAARGLVTKLGKGKLSGKWAAYGESQGGQAAWAAGELADGYGSRPDGDGLTLVGVAAEKPPTDYTWLADGAAGATLGPEDQISYLRLLKGLQVEHPELRLDSYVHGALAEEENQKLVFACFGQGNDQLIALAAELVPQDTTPATPPMLAKLKEWLARRKLPLAGMPGPSAPFFIAASTGDEVVPVATVREAVTAEKAQRLTTIKLVVKDGGRHHEFNDSPEAVEWLGHSFAERRASAR